MPHQKVREYIFLLLCLVILSLAHLLPVLFLSVLCLALSSGILGYLMTKYHYGYVITALGCIFFVYLLFSGNVLSALTVSLCGLTLGISYNLKYPPTKTVCICATVYVLNVAVNIKLADSTSQNALEEAIAAAGNILKESLATVQEAQIPESEINAIISQISATILRCMPSFIVIISICFSLLCFYMFKRICTMKKNDVSFLTPFSKWQADKTVSIIYLVLLLFTRFLPAGTLFGDALQNITLIMTFVFYVFGLSLLEHLLKRFIKGSVLRKFLLIIISMIAIPFMGVPYFILSIGGAFDSFADYRQKKLFRN